MSLDELDIDKENAIGTARKKKEKRNCFCLQLNKPRFSNNCFEIHSSHGVDNQNMIYIIMMVIIYVCIGTFELRGGLLCNSIQQKS